MYYSAGTYESFAHPEKPRGVDNKSAYIIGTGLAGLTAAFYLVRDGRMKGEHIHLLEKLELAGGSCDGRKDVTKGYYMRGGREMDNHFEVMWDVFRDVPSIETPDVSVLDEYYWLNKHDPNYSLCRATVNRGEDAHTDKKFALDKESAMALSKLFITPEKDLEDKKISEVLPESFWDTNFWLYWQTMFAFQRWSSTWRATASALNTVWTCGMLSSRPKAIKRSPVRSSMSRTERSRPLTSSRTISYSSPTAAAPIPPATATRPTLLISPASVTAAANRGICGRPSHGRRSTANTATPTPSAAMWRPPTG